MPWNQDNPYAGYTPMNLSNAGLSWGGTPTTPQYDGGDTMNSLYPNYIQPSLWNPFPMNSGLPMNKFGGGYNPLQSLLSGMMNMPYQPTQWAGPNAYYPNWNDPAGLYANDVAIMGMPPMNTGMGATYWDQAGNQYQAGGQPGFWSPNLLPPVGSIPAPVTTPAPTDPSVPRTPQQGDPDWEGPDPERVAAQQARVRKNAEDFYRNNPEHFMSKLDSRLRKAFGMPQLGNTLNMGQGITPQTNWAGQGVTPQTQPQTQLEKTGRLAAQSVQAQRQEDARIEAARNRNQQKEKAAARQAAARQAASRKAAAARTADRARSREAATRQRERQRAARSRSMGTRARGGRGRESGGGVGKGYAGIR